MAGTILVMVIKGGKFSPLEDQVLNDVEDSVAGAVRDDIVKLERLAVLYILETRYRLSGLETKADHLKKFQAWLDIQAGRAESGSYALVEEAQKFTHLTHDELLHSIETARTAVKDSIGADVGKVLERVLENCSAIFSQQVVPTDILFQEEGLRNIYDFFQKLWDCQGFFELLGHAKPTLKVLEIGAGTGGTTAAALKGLVTEAGEPKERFKNFQNIKYNVLDISKNPMEQGFQAESYDLILASNVLHATPHIHSTLCNGILPGWWLGESDDRPDEPYISVQRWARELQAAGFSGMDAAVYDDDLPYQMNANIVSSIAATPSKPKSLTLLCDHSSSPITHQVETMFVRKGYRLDYCTINDLPRANQDIVSILDLTTPFFDRISPDDLSAFQRFTGNLKSSGMLWVSLSSQVGCRDPRYSQILGVARTIRSELLIDFATFEIDKADEVAFEALTNVFAKFQRRFKELEVDPDWEFAMVEGVINIPRYHWISVANELSVASEEELPRKLQIGKAGLLQSLQWVQEAPIVLAPDEIEVETRAVGLNFKDILVCMGVVDAAKDGIGLEGAGIVRGVGRKVKDFVAGDRVMMFEHGCFCTRVAISAALCTKIPDDLSFDEAATLPCVYATVIHSLLTIGRLEKGQVRRQNCGISDALLT
ncbi:MAG: hypothetical protein Q9201_007050 [Fulgogasparrea decipioides]